MKVLFPFGGRLCRHLPSPGVSTCGCTCTCRGWQPQPHRCVVNARRLLMVAMPHAVPKRLFRPMPAACTPRLRVECHDRATGRRMGAGSAALLQSHVSILDCQHRVGRCEALRCGHAEALRVKLLARSPRSSPPRCCASTSAAIARGQQPRCCAYDCIDSSNVCLSHFMLNYTTAARP